MEERTLTPAAEQRYADEPCGPGPVGCGNPKRQDWKGALAERRIITLAGNRGLMLVGEPGAAKTMLSELLFAAISCSPRPLRPAPEITKA